MVEQQQERSPELIALAAVSLACQLAFFGLVYSNTCSGVNCSLGGSGFVLVIGFFIFIGAITGIPAWFGATVMAVRRHDVLSALSIGLFPLVALTNAFVVSSHDLSFEQTSGFLAITGAWVLLDGVTAALLAITLTRRQAIQRVVAVAALVLAVAVLVASSLAHS